MTKQDRINYIISLYRQLNPEEHVDLQTKINNTTIDKLCTYDLPPYHRIRTWLESKLGEKRQKELKGEIDIESDLDAFKGILNESYQLISGRMHSYGNSWKIMDIKSLAKLMMMKLDRIAELGETNAKTKDELIDVLGYATFSLIKYNEKINSINQNK